MTKMICPFCHKPAEWVENKEVYGRNYGKSYMMWLCRKCDAYVGCHNNTHKPLGIMANAELRGWRITTHHIIDPLWKNGKYSRTQVYNILRQHFGKYIHIGSSDINMCQKIINFVTNKLSTDKHS